MNSRLVWRSGVGVAALLAMTGVAWLLSLPPAPATSAAPPVAPAETDATIAALKPPKRPRPLIAIVGLNDATETTDYLLPYGILRRADVAEVVALGTAPGPVMLYPPGSRGSGHVRGFLRRQGSGLCRPGDIRYEAPSRTTGRKGASWR